MARWLALLSHSKKIPGSSPGKDGRSFCVEFACSPCDELTAGVYRYSGFLLQPKDMPVRRIENAKLFFPLATHLFSVAPAT